MSYHSQFGEDKWIQENLNPPDAALFCEVGAFDGVQSSNTLHFEEDKVWGGLLIEPNPRQWEKCRKHRKTPSLCIAIGTQCGDRPFYIPLWDEGQASLVMPPNEKNVGTEHITQLVTSLDSLWRCFYKIDPYLLSIDTEGTELDVWESCGTMRPEIVIIEFLSGNGIDRSDGISTRLEADGYTQMHRTRANLIFTR